MPADAIKSLREENGRLRKCLDEAEHRLDATVREANRVAGVASTTMSAANAAEDALRNRENQLRVLVENLSVGVALIDETGRFSLYNRQFLKMFGLAPDADIKNVNDQDWSAWQVCDEQGRVLGVDEHPVRKAVLTRSAVRDSFVGVRVPGSPTTTWMMISAEPLFDANGRAEVVICTYTDLTELRAIEERYRAVVDNSPDLIMRFDRDLRALFANRAVLERTFKPASALEGHTPREYGTSAAAAGLWEQTARRALETGELQRFETTSVWHDETRTYDVLAVPERDAGGKPLSVMSVARDITDKKRAEAQFAAIHDHAPFAISLTKMPEGTLVTANDAFLQLFEITREEAIGKTSVDLGISDADSRGRVATELAERGRVRDFEMQRTTRSGTVHILLNLDWLEVGQEKLLLTTIQDISKRKRAQEALAQANALLAEADERKSEFLALLSHELRNPLTPIKNSLYILDRAAPGAEQATRARAVIDRQVEHLARLVDDLLDATRLARGKFRLERTRCDLLDTVHRAVEDHQAIFDAAGLALEVVVPPRRAFVDGDAARLTQVVSNLLSNAAKFTPKGGTVTLTVAEDGPEAVCIRVRDTGVGIPQNILPRLFEPFVQVDGTLDRSKGGLGLGLALVKAVVEMHGGSVEAKSDGPGRGAEIVVRLPAEVQEVLPLDETAPPSSRPAPRRVLVIEDNVDAADSLRDVLEFGGHKVDVAYDGPEGIRKASATSPDVVFCDIGLPGMDGYEVAMAIRAYGSLRSTRLVALSGYAQPADLRRATEVGFDDHIAKPASIEQIEQALNKAERRTA